MKHPIWIIGCGDIGQRLSRLYPNNSLNGIVQSEASQALCQSLGIRTHRINFDEAFSLNTADFHEANVFYFMPPPPLGTQDTRIQHFLQKVGGVLNKVVLISTTGVYGDSQGAWIDENSPLKPKADRAHRRLSAETQLQHWAKSSNFNCIILRVPGIYAKDRLPLTRLKKGLPIINASEAGWTNRIHADDLARVCKAAMESSVNHEIFNVTDGHPSTMTDYFNHVADYANLPRPPQISMQAAEKTLSQGMLSYLKESRRISNTKMLQQLNISLTYPTLASALTDD